MRFLSRLNQNHFRQNPAESDLQARMASYGLAARMQKAAKEAFDLSDEPDHILKMYGIDDPGTRGFGEQCLIARRLVERGVRFVQVLLDGKFVIAHRD